MASAPTLRESIKLHIEQAQAQIERVRQAMEQVGARSGLVETTRLNGDAGRYSRQQRSDRQKQQNEAEGSLAHPSKQPVQRKRFRFSCVEHFTQDHGDWGAL